MLTLIGTGLCDAQDLTLRGKEAIEGAAHVYLEGYTSLVRCPPEEFGFGKPVTVLSREDVEQRIETILETAKGADVVILVIGDPFGATTHADLLLRAHGMGVQVRVVHNASILNAVGELGLELYRFGRTVSVPYWSKGFEPTSFLDGIKENLGHGLHTLCLLDIKADESRFMTVAEGAALLLKAGAFPETRAIGVSRLGWPEQRAVVSTIGGLASSTLEGAPQCIVLPGRLHPIEEEMLTTLKE